MDDNDDVDNIDDIDDIDNIDNTDNIENIDECNECNIMNTLQLMSNSIMKFSIAIAAGSNFSLLTQYITTYPIYPQVLIS